MCTLASHALLDGPEVVLRLAALAEPDEPLAGAVGEGERLDPGEPGPRSPSSPL